MTQSEQKSCNKQAIGCVRYLSQEKVDLSKLLLLVCRHLGEELLGLLGKARAIG